MQEKDQASISATDSSFKTPEQNKDYLIAVGLLILCILTRIIAIPASLWEWDDMLFAHALHKYDLVAHSPHPPGFPVFVAMTRVAYWIIGDEHRALTTIAFIFASLVAPALFYFYREVFEDRRIAFAGALLGCFAPNVWVQGSAGRSDGVAFTLGIIGLTLVIQGFRSQRSLIAGCAVFGLAMGVRTTLLPVMGPVIALVFIALLRRREWRCVVTALLVGAIFILVWFVPLIYKVTWPVYRSVMNNHSQYIFETDTIFSPGQTSWLFLFYRFRRFFVHIWGAKWILEIIYLFSILGLIALAIRRQWKTIGMMAIAFLPYLIFTIILNTPLGGPLYSLPYIPFFIGLAACGLIMIPSSLFYSGRWKVLKNSGMVLSICLTMTIAGWTYPIIRLLHGETSPPVRAFDYLKKTLKPDSQLLFYDDLFSPYVSFYLPNYKVIEYEKNLDPEANLIWSVTDHPEIVLLTSNPVLADVGEDFRWRSNSYGARRLNKLSLERFFGAHITDLSKPRGVEFLSGWYPIEADHKEKWRWMLDKGKVALYRLAESMTLRLRGSIIDTPNPGRLPTLTFRLNEREINRITISSSEFDYQFTIKPSPSLMWSILTIEIDQTITPKRGANSFNGKRGLKCFRLEWVPAPSAPLIKTSPDQYLGTGWNGLENDKQYYWRWISGTSVAHLPAIEGDGRLDLKMAVPLQSDQAEGEVTVEAAGTVLERFHPPSGIFTKTYYVPRSMHRSESLELKLGLKSSASRPDAMQIFYMGWRPSEQN